MKRMSMRIEIENNRTPLNEFIASIRSHGDAVELTQNGYVVAEVKTKGHGKALVLSDAKRVKAAAEGWELVKKARRNVRKSGLTQRQIDRLVDTAVAQVRRENAAHGH